MKIIFKIVFLFHAVLIPGINSGILTGYVCQDKLENTEKSYPVTDDFSFLNGILYSDTNLNFIDNPVLSKNIKYLKKVKQNWGVKTITSANKSYQFPAKATEQDPSLLTDLFDIPDISFPFDYFW